KGRITDYSANIAIVEFESLQKSRYYVNDLMTIQYILGGCQFDPNIKRNLFKKTPIY
ncbi:unnamed protein product, partial [marine sediment metagenome]